MVCGHTPQKSGVPATLPHAVCIATGIGHGGWLTCLEVNTGFLWQANDRGEVRESVLPAPKRWWQGIIRGSSTITNKPHPGPRKPPLRIQPTTLWDYPSQDYGDTHQGRPGYKGATPSYVIWNLLQRYTKPNDLVIDPGESFGGGHHTTTQLCLELLQTLAPRGARND